MPFTTLAFIVFFFALFFAYYAIPRRFQWWLLLVGSMFFYGYASPKYLFLLWTTILVTYIGTVAIGRGYVRRDAYFKLHKQGLSREDKKTYKAGVDKKAKAWLTGTLVILLAMLGVFKYAQFAIDNFFALLGMFGPTVKSDVTVNIIYPVGLSFYLFQSIGYCIDVYREEVSPERNLFKHALFVSFFPQIMQGPIGNYGRLAPQLLSGHEFEYRAAVFGLQRVVWGFFKKLVCANLIATLIDPAWGSPEKSIGLLIWLLYLVLYAVQLYADFSGYMDIACGCSEMLGIRIDENFDCPYFSKNVPEYWRRWHMTLSEWFKNYLFYPVLRSNWNIKLRKAIANKYVANVLPTSVALTIVWFTTGLWHGASWGYVAWGVYYGVFMIAAVVFQPIRDRFTSRFPKLCNSKIYSGWSILRTFTIILVGYAFFRPADLNLTKQIFIKMMSGFGYGVYILFVHVHWKDLAVALCSALLIFAVDVFHYNCNGDSLRARVSRLPWAVRWVGYFTVIYVVIICGTYGDPNLSNFAYFQF